MMQEYVICEKEDLVAMADAVREATGDSETYSVPELRDALINSYKILSGRDAKNINVKSYGAKGDGITDDTEAISNAISALPVGGTLYFPEGVYRVSNINLKSDMIVQGDGWCSVIQLLDSAHTLTGVEDYSKRNNCLNIDGKRDNPMRNIIIRDIKLDGARPTQASGAASQDGRLDGIQIRFASDIHIENVWMYNNGYHGCIMTYVTNVVFDRCKATDNGFRPIHGHTQIYNCRVTNCVCENNGLGLQGGSGYENDSIFFFGAKDLVISDNIVKSNRRGCITVGSDQDTTPEDYIVPSGNITISGNVCECYEDLPQISASESDTGVTKFSSRGIWVYGGTYVLDNVAVTGNTIKNAHEAIYFYSQENVVCSINCTVSGNVILDCSRGIHAVEVTDITISGNQFKNLSETWIYAKNVENCVINSNNVCALGTSGSQLCRMYGCKNIIIQNNHMISNCVHAIYAPDTNTNIVVDGNTMIGFISVDPVQNPNGHTSNNIRLEMQVSDDDSDSGTVEKICVDPYPNSGFVRASLINPNTNSATWRYTNPTVITDADTRYELNTFITIPVGTEPNEYDASAKNTAIVFLAGTDLTSAVGIANLSNGNGAVTFSDGYIVGETFNAWGVQIALTAEKVKELFPSATHVMMQVENVYTDPNNLSNAHKALSDGHAYVYRKK